MAEKGFVEEDSRVDMEKKIQKYVARMWKDLLKEVVLKNLR